MSIIDVDLAETYRSVMESKNAGAQARFRRKLIDIEFADAQHRCQYRIAMEFTEQRLLPFGKPTLECVSNEHSLFVIGLR